MALAVESRFHVLVAEAVREYEILQNSVEASGIHMPSRPTGVVIKLDGRRSPRPQLLSVQSSGSFASSPVESLVKPRVQDGTLDRRPLRAKPLSLRCPAVSHAEQQGQEPNESGLVMQEHHLAAEGITLELEASEISECSKPWVVTAWEHFVIHLVENKHNYVLRPCWFELLPVQKIPVAKLQSRRASEPDSDSGIVARTWTGRRDHFKKTDTQHDLNLDIFQTNVGACMMHPDSLRRVVWGAIGMVFLALDLFYLTMGGYGVARSRWLDIIDGLYWTLDVICCFRTGTYLNGEVNMTARNSMKEYVRGWFLFDVILVVYQWSMICIEADATKGAKGASYIRYTRLARLVKLLRLTKLRMMFKQVLQRIDDIYVLLGLRLVLYTFGLTFYVHVSSVIWFSIGQSHQAGWVQQYDGMFQTWPMNYIISFNWAVTQMQGSAAVMPGTTAEYAASSLHYMMSIIVLAMFISKLTTVMQAIADIAAEEQKLMKIAYDFMKYNDVRVQLRIKLQHFLTNEARERKKANSQPQMSQLLGILPPTLRQALLMNVRAPATSKGLLMKSLSWLDTSFAEQLTCLMCSTLRSPGERIFQQGVICNRVYFLEAGVGWYLKCSPLISHVKEALNKQSSQEWRRWRAAYWEKAAYPVEDVGTIWCEAALFVRWIHTGDLEADRNKGLSLLVLEVQTFDDLVATFTEVQAEMVIHAGRVHAYLAKCTNVTDLLKSESVMMAE